MLTYNSNDSSDEANSSDEGPSSADFPSSDELLRLETFYRGLSEKKTLKRPQNLTALSFDAETRKHGMSVDFGSIGLAGK